MVKALVMRKKTKSWLRLYWTHDDTLKRNLYDRRGQVVKTLTKSILRSS